MVLVPCRRELYCIRSTETDIGHFQETPRSIQVTAMPAAHLKYIVRCDYFLVLPI
ncbi:hypothetical protein Fmac_013730 [Flemingia macrophylla]|uniref:Uncharacterized protein n=1 Tax=Flemingia macrophylla TaxID=520843 RepID=A0ABD1MU03_9FABA